MTIFTFPRLVGAGIAAGIATGLAHQAYATAKGMRHHDGFEAGTLRCTSGNVVTYYRREGEPGAPVLAFEAGLISTSLVWRLLADNLSTSATVVLYDRAGYRRSLRRCPTAYCLQESVDDLTDLVGEVADPDAPCLLVGYSLGAYLVHRAAAALPDRVQGVILVDPNHPRELEASVRQREGARGSDLTIRLAPLTVLFGGGLLMDKNGIMRRVEGSPYYHALRLEASTFSAWRTAAREWGYSYPFMLDRGRPLDQLSVPVNVVAAEATLQLVPEQQELFQEYLASGTGGEVVTIPNANHQSVVAGPEGAPLTAEAIEKIVSRVHEERPGEEQ